MDIQEIDSILTGENSEVTRAHQEIVDLQNKVTTPLKTGVDHLDSFLIGGLTNKMVFIGSRPGMGKTTNAEKILTNLLNPDINPNPNISVLKMNLEMPFQSLLLRDYKNALGRGMKDIISKPFSEHEKEVIRRVVSKHSDSRIINFSKTVNGEDLRYLLRRFCALSDAKGMTEKVVIVDHLHIYSTKKEIDEVLSICNEAKMADSKLSFIFYFQFGRTLEDVWRDSKEKKANPLSFLPNSSHIYNTDSLMQYATVVMGMVIPQTVDLEEFASVYKERNMHLKEHFTASNDSNTTVRLKGRNRIYYNYIKLRDLDDMDDARLYCDILNPEYEPSANRHYEQSKKPAIVIPEFNFETNTVEIIPPPPLGTLTDAFEAPELKEETPPF